MSFHSGKEWDSTTKMYAQAATPKHCMEQNQCVYVCGFSFYIFFYFIFKAKYIKFMCQPCVCVYIFFTRATFFFAFGGFIFSYKNVMSQSVVLFHFSPFFILLGKCNVVQSFTNNYTLYNFIMCIIIILKFLARLRTLFSTV